ncbi:MAG: tetraacyldisaccharide 4'-kinase, partial [Pseudomonadota bacterium]
MSQLRHCLGVVRRCAYAFLAQRLPALWYRRSLSPWLWPLLPFSWLFCLLLALRSGCFRVGLCRTQSLPVPVIVVGNLSVGGTGKTPLVLWLAEALLARGWRVGIVSRGYGGDGGYGAHGQSADPSALHQALPESDPAQVGDEPLLLARRSGAPVFVGRDRVAAGRALLAAYPECAVILSDDGLQHRRLGRLIELCVFGARGVGNGHLLPAGPLRATLASYFCLPKSNPDPDPDPLLQPNILRAVIWHGAADPRL